ncbi:MAG TPA: proline racemase family protein [bacterium]|nr:proline racemase family protein [bacterium]
MPEKKSEFEKRLRTMQRWEAPSSWRCIETIEAHTGGEPLRIIISGLPPIKGQTILQKRAYLKTHLDHLRTALMWEPRGHADMYGCIITPPVAKNSDFGVIFLHNEGYSTMCGHGIIAVTKAALETGLIRANGTEVTLRIDSPAGLITSIAQIRRGKVQSVRFLNVPSFVQTLDAVVDVPGLGRIRYDLAYGGAFYAFVHAEDASVTMDAAGYRGLIERGMMIKRAVMQSVAMQHPFEPELNFLYGTIFTGPGHTTGADSRNVCIFADGEVDRSPTGTGVSARMAIHHARGALRIGEPMAIESITGSRFVCRVHATTTYGNYPAVIPAIEGTAHLCGKSSWIIDPADSLRDGFFFR